MEATLEGFVNAVVDGVRCQRCRSFLTAPRLLPCGHLFCSTCIFSAFSGHQATFECFTCKTQHPSNAAAFAPVAPLERCAALLSSPSAEGAPSSSSSLLDVLWSLFSAAVSDPGRREMVQGVQSGNAVFASSSASSASASAAASRMLQGNSLGMIANPIQQSSQALSFQQQHTQQHTGPVRSPTFPPDASNHFPPPYEQGQPDLEPLTVHDLQMNAVTHPQPEQPQPTLQRIVINDSSLPPGFDSLNHPSNSPHSTQMMRMPQPINGTPGVAAALAEAFPPPRSTHTAHLFPSPLHGYSSPQPPDPLPPQTSHQPPEPHHPPNGTSSGSAFGAFGGDPFGGSSGFNGTGATLQQQQSRTQYGNPPVAAAPSSSYGQQPESLQMPSAPQGRVTLVVSGLPGWCQEAELWNLFRPYGESLLGVEMLPLLQGASSKSSAVFFSSAHEALQAILGLHGCRLRVPPQEAGGGGRPLLVLCQCR